MHVPEGQTIKGRVGTVGYMGESTFPRATSLLGPLGVMCPVPPLLLGNLYLTEQKELMFLFYM